MRRFKIMLALLAPVCWLAGASYGSADATAGGTSHGCRTSISAAAGHGQPSAARDSHPVQQALRNLTRRAGTASGSVAPLHPVPIPAKGLASLVPPAGSFRVVAAPAELVQSWHFLCRTAAEPRSPSTVS